MYLSLSLYSQPRAIFSAMIDSAAHGIGIVNCPASASPSCRDNPGISPGPPATSACGNSLSGHLKSGHTWPPSNRPNGGGKFDGHLGLVAVRLGNGDQPWNPGLKALNPRGLGTESPSEKMLPSDHGAVSNSVQSSADLDGRISSDHVWPDWGDPRGEESGLR